MVSVEPANVTVSAVKPRGNPLAAGKVRGLVTAGAPGPEAVTVRLRETVGKATTARLRLAATRGPGAGISAAWLTDLLEESDGAPLPVQDGTVTVDIAAFGTVTLVVRTSSVAAAGGRLLSPTEPVEPVYARYWLHGKGPAPAGNLPVAVHFSSTRVALADPGDAATLTLTVGCGAEPASGTVELVVPSGITVAAAEEDPHAASLDYELAPGGYAAWELTVRAAPGTAPGRYFVAARIYDEFGHLIEDTAMVAVGERRWPDPHLPPEESLELLQLDYAAAAAEVELKVLTPELRLIPGARGELQVRLTNRLASELHGEAQLVSPFGTWQMLAPWTRGFGAAPQESVTLRFTGSVPVTERPGSRWWALVKVMYFGRVRYTEAIPVVVEPGN